MKRKISLSTTVTLVLLTMALTVSLTMLLAMRHFNNQLQLVSKRQAMYSYINEVDKIVREYYPDMNESLLQQGLAQGYIAGIDDPYAAYYSPDDYRDEKLRLAGRAKNIGVELGEMKNTVTGTIDVVVSSVNANSAAARAGIVKGDVVTEVNGLSVTGRTIQEWQELIRSSTEISLTVHRGEGYPSYPITADEYDVRSVDSTVLDNIGYVKIMAFYGNTPAQFKNVVDSLLKQEVRGIVFDLRSNVGGSSKAVQDMLSQVMPLGAYGTMTDTKGNVTKLTTKVSKGLTLPTVTLIDANTAGEAEFFAGVLQEAGLTTVMGQRSAGKAKYQNIFVLEQNNSALRLTIGEYGLMKGGSWEGKGIVPTEVIELPPDYIENPALPYNENPQVQAAVDFLKKSSDKPNVDPPIGGTTTNPTDPTTTTAPEASGSGTATITAPSSAN